MRYDMMSRDIRAVADKWENDCLKNVTEVDAAARKLSTSTRSQYLTNYSVMMAQQLFDIWKGLDGYLLVKYIDGNVKSESSTGVFIDNGNGKDIPAKIQQPGYNEKWKRAVAADNGEVLKVIK